MVLEAMWEARMVVEAVAVRLMMMLLCGRIASC